MTPFIYMLLGFLIGFVVCLHTFDVIQGIVTQQVLR